MIPNYRTARDARRRGEQGFTLIEVMVVVLIIGILLAVGIPTFIGARTRAQDRAAQSNLRTAQTTAFVLMTDVGDFGSTFESRLAEAEPSLTWNFATTPSTAENRVSVARSSDSSEFAAAALSDSGRCFYIRLSVSRAARYGSSSTNDCTGNHALTVTGSSW